MTTYSLVVTIAGAAYFADQGRPVLAVLSVIPGYFVVAYVMVLLSSLLPGAEKRRFESARAAAFPDATPLPQDTVMHPAYLGSMTETTYSGGGFLGWPESGDLVFRATAHPPQTFTYGARAFTGFKTASASRACLTSPTYRGKASRLPERDARHARHTILGSSAHIGGMSGHNAMRYSR